MTPPIPVVHFDHDGTQISTAAWRLLHCTSGTRLARACRAHGLPVSGTNEAKARRLLAAGVSTA
jgi:hypothetical protein